MDRASGLEKPVNVAFVVLLFFLFASSLGSFSSPAHGQTPAVNGVGPWVQQDNYGSSSTSGGILILGVSCVAYSGYEYCVGGQNLQKLTNPDISDVFYASVSSTGSLGPWTETTDYGATSGTSGSGGLGIEWPSCVQYNGYVYCVGGATNSGTTSQVFFAQLSSSGVGAWKETTDYGAASGHTGSGGVSISSQACVDDSGTMFCIGGTVGFSPVSDVFYANLTSSGVGPWTETTDYGASSGNTGSGGVPIYGTTCVAYLSTLICVNGDTTGNTGTSGVYYAKDPVDLKWIQVAPFPGAGYWEFCNVPAASSPKMLCSGGGSNGVESGTIQTTESTTSTTTSSTTTTTSTAPTTSTPTTPPTSTTTTTTSTTGASSTTETSESTAGVTTTPTSSSNNSLLLGGIVVALLIVGLLGYLFWRRTKKPEVPPVVPPMATEKPPPPKETPTGTTPPDNTPCCGPDITDNVLAGMLKLMQDFFTWNSATQSTEFGYLTAVTGEPSYNNAWDIEELAPSGGRSSIWEFNKPGVTYQNAKDGYMKTLAPYVGRCMKPPYPCDPSVMFLNNCHHPQVVNYVEWGVLARLREWYEENEAHKMKMQDTSTGIANDAAATSSTYTPVTSYGDTTYGDFHKARSGTVPGLTDPHYQDQVAMCNVGWRLAEDYITRMKSGGFMSTYKLGQVNRLALQAILEMYEDKSRPTANCKNGCGKYSPPNAFRYVFGDKQPLRAGLVSDY